MSTPAPRSVPVLGHDSAPRRPWEAPRLTPLPPLVQLTLQSGDITGECTPGGGCGFSFVPFDGFAGYLD